MPERDAGLVRPVKQEAGGEAVTEPLQWSRYEGMEALSGRRIPVGSAGAVVTAF